MTERKMRTLLQLVAGAVMMLAAGIFATSGQAQEEDRRLAVRSFFGEPIVRLNEDMTYDWTTLDGGALYRSAMLLTAPEHREAAKRAMSAPITAVVGELDCEKERQRCEDGREAVRLWNRHDGLFTEGATGETIMALSAGVFRAVAQSGRLAHIFSQAQARMHDTLAELLVTSHELDAEEQRNPTSLVALLRTMAEMERSR